MEIKIKQKLRKYADKRERRMIRRINKIDEELSSLFDVKTTISAWRGISCERARRRY